MIVYSWWTIFVTKRMCVVFFCRSLRVFLTCYKTKQNLLFSFCKKKSEATFVYDAFSLLAHTLEKSKVAALFHDTSSPKASCSTGQPWINGPILLKHLKMSKFKGLSGHIEFDKLTGYRKNLTITIVDKAKSGVDIFGYWRESNTNNSIVNIRSYAKEKSQVLNKLNRHLNVTTKLVIFFEIFLNLNKRKIV